VPAADFTFSLHLVEGVGFDEMLRDLAGTVFRHVGYSAASIGTAVDEMTTRVGATRARGIGCDVEFRAHGGHLEIVVSQGGMRVYHTQHRLP
jgi:hypothetical protein